MLVIGHRGAMGNDQDGEWVRLLEMSDPVLLAEWAWRYENAKGPHRDFSRARQLYCAAARRGYAPAQVRLAWMYANGVGAPRDLELAGAWLRVAAAQGSLGAKKFLAFLGYPPRGRQPRCSYTSRVDHYAGTTKPLSNRNGARDRPGAITSFESEAGGDRRFATESPRQEARLDELIRQLTGRRRLDSTHDGNPEANLQTPWDRVSDPRTPPAK